MNGEEFNPDVVVNQNVIFMFGDIDKAMAERVIKQLGNLALQFEEKSIPPERRIITLLINSHGGNVVDGLAIYDAMNYIRAKICTVGIGVAESMAAFLLSAGTRGFRRATENCEIIIHQPMGGVNGQASDMLIEAKHIECVRSLLNRILSENTGQSVNYIRKITDRDKIMTAYEALRLGLIDEILPSANKAKKSG